MAVSRSTPGYSVKAFSKFLIDWRSQFVLDECFRLGRDGIGVGNENFVNGTTCRFIEKPETSRTCAYINMGVRKGRRGFSYGPATGFLRWDPRYCDGEPDAEAPPAPPGSKPF